MRTLPILLILLSLNFTGCDNPQTETPLNKPETIEWRFGHDMPESSAHHLGAVKFAELVRIYSEGKIEITIHPNQSLGNDHEMIDMAQAGELDIILPPSAKLSTLVPAMQLFDLPYLFLTAEDAYRVLDTEAGQQLLNATNEHGLVGLGFWESGFKQFTANKPLISSGDFKDMKFRIMRSEVLRDQFYFWNAKPIAIKFGKTRDALAEGVVDGQENPLGTIFNMKFHEVQPYLMLSNHGYLAQILAVSAKSFNKLPEKLQNVLLQAASEATTYQRQQAQNREQFYLDEIKKTQTQVVELPEATRASLQTQAVKTMEKHRLTIGTRLIETTLHTLSESRKFNDDELVIALDADLAGNSAFSGLAIRRGIEIAMDEINEQGGVLGKKFTLVTRDNAMVSARGIDNLERFSQIPNLVAVFGGISSPVVLSELDIIHQKKLLFLDPWAAATHIVDNDRDPNFVFRLSVRDEYAAGFLLPKALEISNKVALLLANNGWGRSNEKALTEELRKRQLEAATIQWFNWGETHHDQIIDEIYKSGAQVIIYVGVPMEAAAFIERIVNKEQVLPIISHWGITGGNFGDIAGDNLDKIDLRVLQTYSFIGNDNPKAREVVKRYKSKYSAKSEREIIAATGTAHAYDLVHLLAMAIKKSGKTDSDSIRLELESLGKYEGLVRTYDPPFTKQRHDALDSSDFSLGRYEDGVLVPF